VKQFYNLIVFKIVFLSKVKAWKIKEQMIVEFGRLKDTAGRLYNDTLRAWVNCPREKVRKEVKGDCL
jgi:hypothetical protein